jgi:hypothetical protein
VVNVFDVWCDVFVGGVDQGLVQVDQENQSPIPYQPRLIFFAQHKSFLKLLKRIFCRCSIKKDFFFRLNSIKIEEHHSSRKIMIHTFFFFISTLA